LPAWFFRPAGLGAADAEKTLDSLRYMCALQVLCPLSAANYDTLTRAIEGERCNQFLLGLNLISGDGAPTDRKAGLEWKMVAGWHKLDFEQMKATPITVPDKERRTCPPMP
jgi:hypothetical protein